MNIETIYRRVAEGSLSKGDALAMIRELEKARRASVIPAAPALASSAPPPSPSPSPIRRALSLPGKHTPEFSTASRPAKRSLTPLSSVASPVTSTPEAPSVAVALKDCGQGIVAIQLGSRLENALDIETLTAIKNCFSKIKERTDAKVVLITDPDDSASGPAPAGNLPNVESLQSCLDAIRQCDLPVIASLRGHALNAGWLLASACDLPVCSTASHYGCPNARAHVSSLPGAESYLRQRFGEDLAAQLGQASVPVTGAKLAGYGVSAFPSAEVGRRALDLANELAQFPRESLSLLKHHLRRDPETSLLGGSPTAPRFNANDPWQLFLANVGENAELAASPAAQLTHVPFESEVIRLAVSSEGVLVATLADHSGKNAFSSNLAGGIQRLFDHVRANAGYKALVLTGYDHYFASGGTKEGLLSIHQGIVRYSDAPLYELPLSCEIPVIAAMQGHAVGAGWAFAMFCDLAVFSEDSIYSSRFMRYGFTPGFGSTLIFEERFGHDLGREILFAARDYSGLDLKARGIPMPVLPSSNVLPLALRFARRLAGFPRETLVATKRASARPLLDRLPLVIQSELAMHDRTFVGNAGAEERIRTHFQGGERPQPSGPAAAAPLSESANPPGEAPASLRQALRESLAEELRLSPAEIEDDTPFTDLGLDSITGVTWVRRVNKRFGLSITATHVYQAPNLVLFAGLVAREIAGAQPASPVPAAAPALAPAPPPPVQPPPEPVAPSPPAPAKIMMPPARHPLSEGQKGLWLLHRMAPEMASYNVPVPFLIKDSRWVAVLDQVLVALVARHLVLAAVIAVDDQGQPYQYIPVSNQIYLQRESLRGASGEAALDQLRRAFKQPFKLNHDPLVRAQLFEGSPDGDILLLTVHHIIFDGTSLGLLIRDLMTLWSGAVAGGLPSETSAIVPAFFDFIQWERSFLASDDARRELDYWRQKLAHLPPPLEFPADRQRPSRPTHTGATISAQLTPALSNGLRNLARQRRVSLFTLLVAVYKTLLHRYTREESLVVGVPVAGRPTDASRAAIGYFVNMVAIQSLATGRSTFTDYLEQVKHAVLEGLDHSRYPFRKLLSDLRVESGPTLSPVFQTVFVLQNFIPQDGFEAAATPSASVELLPHLHQEGEFDLRFEMIDGRDHLTSSISYNSDLFDQPTIARVLEHFSSLAGAIVSNPATTLDECLYLPDAERRLIELEWNNTRRAYPDNVCLHEVFEQRAHLHPARVALVSDEGTVTYRELDRRASALAAYLQSLGLQPEDRVALCLQRSVGMVAAVLGVLKAGAAYVPIDPGYPKDRIAFLLADSQARLVLTDAASASHLPDQSENPTRRILLNSDHDLIEEFAADHTLIPRRASPASLAYVIYTSGSTGQPKGVMVEHRQILNTLFFLEESYPVAKSDAYLLKTNYTFDVSLSELFGWFMGEGCLVILPPGDEKFPDRVARAIRDHGVTHVNFVPPALGLFLHTLENSPAREKLDGLKFVMVAGEAFPKAMVAAAVRAFPRSRVENIYGPTETSIYAAAYSCASGDFSSVNTPIGKPISNTQLYVLDSRRQSTGLGAPGELCVGGLSVARGYLSRPELTRERFVPDPFNPGSRLYLTGDLVRWLPDGNIEYLGRIDQQIKIRGYRVEPGEIEALLNLHPDVQESVVVVVENNASRQLVAFLVPKPGVSVPDSASLAAYLGARLPEYMIPAFFAPVEAIPTTSSGKIDRRALANRAFTRQNNPAGGVAEGEIENRLAAIWKDLLRLESVGVNDRFFEVGGDSLLAVMLADRVSREFKCDFSAAALFKHPTIKDIAREIAPPTTPTPAPASALAPAPSATRPPGPREILLHDSPSQIPAYYADSVAIVGMSCRFPGANNLEAFWSLLREGRDGGRFLTGEELRERGVPDSLIRDPKFVPLSLSIEDKESFDAEFFNLSARNALLMDPQFRLLLAHSWQAVEDAGYAPGGIPDTSVFMSAGNNLYQLLLDRAGVVEPSDAYTSWVMSQGGTIPTMISYALGLTGPSLFVHSNCSSSLAGLHLACQSLRSGESKCALVGGATVFYPSRDGYLHRPGLNFSSDGRCKTFDASADGMIGGEGVAVVMLKRAADAVADGDAIYALIRGVAMNNDGPEKAGYFSPGARGQAAVIDKVLRSTGVDPESIHYIEAHGTGTRLGDPVEIMALTDAYRRHTSRAGFCGIGSVKSNIGHSDTAAGLAGCLKLALSLHRRELPATLHFEKPNPAIDFAHSPFYVADKFQPWERGAAPRRAALSSFGVGGTNVHAILEECLPLPLAGENSGARSPSGPFLIPLSAKNPERLQEMIGNLRCHLEQNKQNETISLGDMAFTLWTGRRPMEARAIFLARDRDELLSLLTNAASQPRSKEGAWFGTAGKPEDREFLNPEDARAIATKWFQEGRLDKIARLWSRGFSIDGGFLFAGARHRRLHLPSYPFAKDRHSIELPASPPQTSPQTTPLPTTARLPLIREEKSGVGEAEFSIALSGREFFLAHHVVAGRKLLPAVTFLELTRAAVAQTAVDKPGVSVRFQDVVWLRPFHMDAEPRTLHLHLQSTSPDRMAVHAFTLSPEQTQVAHFRGTALLESRPSAPALDLAALRQTINQHRQTGTESYHAFAAAGFQYGPGFQALVEVTFDDARALAKLALPSFLLADRNDFVLHPGIMDAALQACALLSLQGDTPLDPNAPSADRLGLPFALESLNIFQNSPASGWSWIRPSAGSRPSDRVQKLDIDIADDQGRVCVQMRGFSSRPVDRPAPIADSPSCLNFHAVWQAKPLVSGKSTPPFARRALITCDVERVSLDGTSSTLLQPPNDPRNRDPWFLETSARVFQIVQESLSNTPPGPILLQLLVPSQGPASSLSALAALFRTARLENPRFHGQVIEVRGDESVPRLAEILDSNACAPEETHIRHTGADRLVPGWREAFPDALPAPVPWKDDGVYVITGGAGAIGRIFAREIVAQTQHATVLLLGRSPVSAAELQASGLPSDRVHFHAVDISIAAEVEEFARGVRGEYGSVHGILHAAGIVHDNFILRKSHEEFKSVLAPKVAGTINLHRAMRDLQPGFIVLFSSGVAWFGNSGQADYATANAFMDHFAGEQNQPASRAKIVSIAWPLWEGGGMTVSNSTRVALDRIRMSPMTAAQGVAALSAALASGQSRWMTLPGDPSRLRTLMNPTAPEPQKAPSAPAPAQAPAPRRPAAPSRSLDILVTDFVRQAVSDAAKRPVEKIASDTPFENYGLDSILQVSVIERLQEVVGDLAKTLLFEHTTLRELVDYLLRSHSDALRRHFAEPVPLEAAPPPAEPAQTTSAALLPATPEQGRPAVSASSDDIAIIGVSGRYPMSGSLEELWENLKSGRNCLASLKQRPSLSESNDHASKNGARNGHAEFFGGLLDEVDRFDHELFKVPPERVSSLAPESRLFLEIAWETFEDAGYSRPVLKEFQTLSGVGVGVFAGSMYDQHAMTFSTPEEMALASNASEWHLPNRVSHFFDLTGPSVAVNSACSSSLLAIHLACESLKQGNCSMALAGGVNLTLHPSKFTFLKAAHVLGSGAASRSFGAGDGYIPGEGVGAVLLKPLAHALRDGNRIHGVIRASLANHAGGRQSYTVPDPNRQAALIAECIRRSGVHADSIGYVESAANGSPLGDPIEVLALKKAFAQFTTRENFCALGSVKSNLGHLEAASGISQLSKVLLQFKHRSLAASLHSRPRNPSISLEGSPFYVQEEPAPWNAMPDLRSGGELPRRSLVISVGAGGTGVCLVVEEHLSSPSPSALQATAETEARILLLSAQNRSSLFQNVRRLASHLDRHPIARLDQIAAALASREPLTGCRAAVIARSIGEALARLNHLASTETADEAAGVYFSVEPCPDQDCPAILLEGANLSDVATRWLAGASLNTPPARTGFRPADLSLPKYAFDHSRRFHAGLWESQEPAIPPAASALPMEAKNGLNGHANQGTLTPFLVAYQYDEPFLRDHTVAGKQILVGVAHASLAVDAFFRWFPDQSAVHLRQLTFIQPVEVASGEQVEVRVQPEGFSLPLDFKVLYRLPTQSDWRPTATGRLESAAPAFGSHNIASLKTGLAPFNNLNALYEAGEPAFKVGPSFRAIRQLFHHETLSLAELDLSDAITAQPRSYALHPVIAYSAFTALLPLLKPAGFHGAFLPFGLESLQFLSTANLDRCWIVVRVAKCVGEMLLFDVDLLTTEGREVARYRGCSIQRLREPIARASAQPVPPRAPTHENGSSSADAEWQFSLSAVNGHSGHGTSNLSPEAKAELVVRQSAALQLDCPVSLVDRRRAFMDFPFGSLGMVEVIQRIGRVLEEPLSPTLAFEHPTISEFSSRLALDHAEKLSRLTAFKSGPRLHSTPLEPPLALEETFPLSEGQKGLWALQKAFPEMGAYNCPLCFRVPEPLDPQLLQAACHSVLRQHPLLAMAVEEMDGHPIFAPRPPERFQLSRVDARGWSDDDVQSWVKRAAKEPFNLATDPLLRGTILTLSGDQTLVLFSIHHLVFDGSSYPRFIGALLDAFSNLKLGLPPKVTPVRTGFRDYVLLEKSRLSGVEGSRRLEYWKNQLAGELPTLELPLDLPRSCATNFAGATVSTILSPSLAAGLKAFASEHSLYPSSIFLAAFKELLRLYSGQSDLIVGMPVNERSDPRFIPLIGYFISMIPVRSRSVGDLPFLPFARDVQQSVLSGLAHRYPLPALVRDLKLSGRGHHPLFNAAFEFQNFLRPEDAAAVDQSAGHAFPLKWFDGLYQEGEYEVALEVVEEPDRFRLNLKYNPTLFLEASASLMLGRLLRLLESGLASPLRPLSTSLILPESERHTLLHKWNNTRAEYPDHLCIHELFEAQARRTPSATAAVYGDQTLSYQELDDRSTILAQHLQSLGVRPDHLVGLCVERSLEMIVGLLGILKADGAYLPLDPDYPDERLRFILEDSRARWILTQSALIEKVSGFNQTDAAVLPLDVAPKPLTRAGHSKKSLSRDVHSRNLAYVLYTSGSTGAPKGVMIEHRALCNRIVWMQREYQLDASDRVLQKTPFSFDVSGWEFHWPLMAGAALVFAEPGKHKDPEYLSRLIESRGITTLHFVPSMLQAFLTFGQAGRCASLRRVFCSGEELTPSQARLFFERLPGPALHNLYGPTEAAIDVSYRPCRPNAARVPIGKPISNVQLHVLDSGMSLLPIGIPGELCIGGDALARGYLNRPDLTADKFVPSPFEPGAKLYRTGDLARWNTDGEIEFLGRLDHQVKIRGCRIELGEIETALREIEGVAEAVVVVRANAEDRQLLAFYVASSPGLTPQFLRARLKQRLPDHMIPGAFLALDRIPLTSSGKIDRKILSRPASATSHDESNRSPRPGTEMRLATLWRETLAVDTVGHDDDFFEIGGHSLSALALMTRINQEFHARLPLATLFEARTVADLAARLDSDTPPLSNAWLAALQPKGTRPPLILLPGLGGGARDFNALGRALSSDQPVFLFQFPGLEGERDPLESIEELASFFINQLPGPPPGGYRLAGWSMGGLIAFEMACQLSQKGLPVRQLALIDSYLQSHLDQFVGLGARLDTSPPVAPPLPGHPPPGAGPDLATATLHLDRVLAAGRRALASYNPRQKFSGDVLYLYASQNAAPGPRPRQAAEARKVANRAEKLTRNGWKPFLPRIARGFVPVPADHFSILREPAVAMVAGEINSSLLRAPVGV